MPNILQGSPVPVSDPIRVGTVTAQLPQSNNPFAVFAVVYAGGSTGIQVNVTVGTQIQALSIQLLRGISLDITRAALVQSWSGPFVQGQQLAYSDTDQQALTNPKSNYWLSIIYQQVPNLISQNIGPQIVFVNAGVQSQEQIQAFSLSNTPIGGGLVQIGVSFQKPTAPDFGSIQIFATGYNGIPQSQLLAQSTVDPFNFTLQQTGETVTFQADAVNVQGTPFPNGPTKILMLTATTTVPCVVYNAVAVSISNGNQISFVAGPESNITQYKLYRAASGGGFGAATLVGSIAPGQQSSYTILDLISTPANWEYYLIATNTSGDSSPSPVIVPGASFASGSQGTGAVATPILVTNGANKTVAVVNVKPQGTNYFQIPLATFTGSSLSDDALGYCTVDGSGHVTAVIVTYGGTYAGTDVVACSIHY